MNNTRLNHYTGREEWNTPAYIIEAARSVMGDIDLDPATNQTANMVINAKTFYTKENSGLDYNWYGRVWMNPPYTSKTIMQFIEKLSHEVEIGNVTEFIVLVNNATETRWFATLLKHADVVGFSRKRVKFWSEEKKENGPIQGQAFVYHGAHEDRFVREFSDFAWCTKPIK